MYVTLSSFLFHFSLTFAHTCTCIRSKLGLTFAYTCTCSKLDTVHAHVVYMYAVNYGTVHVELIIY